MVGPFFFIYRCCKNDLVNNAIQYTTQAKKAGKILFKCSIDNGFGAVRNIYPDNDLLIKAQTTVNQFNIILPSSAEYKP